MVTPDQLINGYLPQAQGAIESAPQFSANPQGGGVLGPNPTYGGMQGFLAAKGEMRAENQDVRAERQLKMGEEEFGWKRQEYARYHLIQQGMVQAAQSGGYEGVIAYLQKNDPEKALSFQDAKEKLDSQIMENSVMRDIKIPEAKQNALLESYGKLGQMGQAILKAPAGDREAMYQQLLPIAKVINPSMPDNLGQAAPILYLAAAQATPANEFFKNQMLANAANSNVGKDDIDYRTRLAAGVSPDDPTMVALKNKIAAANITALNAQAAATNVQVGMAAKNQDMVVARGNATMHATKGINDVSKQANSFYDAYASFMGAYNELQKDPKNTAAQNHLGMSFITAMGVGKQQSDKEQALKYAAAGYENAWKKIQSMATGRTENLLPWEQEYIKNDIMSVKNEVLKSQLANEAVYKPTVDKGYEGLVDWNNVALPSKKFALYDEQSAKVNGAAQGKVPPDLQAAADAAVASKKWTKEQAQAVVDKEMARLQSQAQAQSQAQSIISPSDYSQTPDSQSQMENQIIENQKQIIANNKTLYGQ